MARATGRLSMAFVVAASVGDAPTAPSRARSAFLEVAHARSCTRVGGVQGRPGPVRLRRLEIVCGAPEDAVSRPLASGDAPRCSGLYGLMANQTRPVGCRSTPSTRITRMAPVGAQPAASEIEPLTTARVAPSHRPRVFRARLIDRATTIRRARHQSAAARSSASSVAPRIQRAWAAVKASTAARGDVGAELDSAHTGVAPIRHLVDHAPIRGSRIRERPHGGQRHLRADAAGGGRIATFRPPSTTCWAMPCATCRSADAHTAAHRPRIVFQHGLELRRTPQPALGARPAYQ